MDHSVGISFFDRWGNAASVVGFCISLVNSSRPLMISD